MRRWLALLAGVAAIAVTGTAVAMTGASEEPVEQNTATATTVDVETTTTEVKEPAQPEPAAPVEKVEEEEMVWEEPDDYVPYEPRDHTPPEIEILHPEDGQVFESHEVVFEGTTEPGARVFFGDHQADVGEDGGWRIVLELDEGEHVIEAKAVEESGNHAIDSVTVVVDIPKPKVEEPKSEEPKEEPNKEEPKEEPKKEEPKEEEPEEVEWEFTAHQSYGECSESPPYDVFYGTGKPGSLIVIEAEYARKTTEVNEHGEWEVKVVFEGAPIGESFKVWVVDKFGHEKVFEFVHTD